MIRFALIVASTLGFVLTAALGNFMAPLLQELERFRPQEQQEPQTPVQSRVPALGGLCLMVSTLAAVGVGWTAACIAQPTLLGSESQLMTRLLIALFGAQAFGAIGLADDAARLRSRAQLGLRRLPRLALEAAAAAAVLVLLAVNGCRQHWPGHCWLFCCGIFRPQSCGRAAAAACIWPGCWAACRCASGMQS